MTEYVLVMLAIVALSAVLWHCVSAVNRHAETTTGLIALDCP